MPLKMILAVAKGIRPMCKEIDVWLFQFQGKIICDDCIKELEDKLEREGT